MIQPWERKDDEPGLWYERFDKYYRPLGTARSLQEAYYAYYKELHGKIPDRQGYTTSWGKAASDWDWSERAEAYDRYIHEEVIQAEKEDRIKMSRRHIRDAESIQTLAMNKILDEGIPDVGTALRAFRQAVEIERKARGVPDHLVEISEMTDEELEKALARELTRAHLQGVSSEDSGDDPITKGEGVSTASEGESGEPGDTPRRGKVSDPDSVPKEAS